MKLLLNAFLVLLTALAFPCSADSPLPSELLTPELSAYLNSDEGKRQWNEVKNSLMEEFEKNRADPALVNYFILLKQHSYEEAFRAIESPAIAGHSQAQTELAYLYMSGLGTIKDLDKAIYWFNIASNKNNLMATSILASIYFLPQFERQDLSKAEPLYRKCALKLRAPCITQIASLYAVENSAYFNLAKSYAWASFGKDLNVPLSDDLISALAPHMNESLYQQAAEEKKGIYSTILGKKRLTSRSRPTASPRP